MEQLAKMLGDTAEIVAQFRHPLSRQLLQDILEELDEGDMIVYPKYPAECSYFYMEVQIQVCFPSRFPRLERSLQPECYAQVAAFVHSEDCAGAVRYSPHQPRTPEGLNKLLHWAQETVANFKRRGGFCRPCLALEFPRKRLRVHGQTRCGGCFLEEHLE